MLTFNKQIFRNCFITISQKFYLEYISASFFSLMNSLDHYLLYEKTLSINVANVNTDLWAVVR